LHHYVFKIFDLFLKELNLYELVVRLGFQVHLAWLVTDEGGEEDFFGDRDLLEHFTSDTFALEHLLGVL
jgi:hypothetical protein